MSAALRTILPLGLVVLEFSWLYPWLLLIGGAFYGAVPPMFPPGSAFVMLAGGFLTVRVALARPWGLGTVRAVVVGTGMAFGLAVVKSAYYPGVPVYDPRWIGALLISAHDALPVVLPPVMAALVAALLWWRGLVLGEREFTHFEVERGFRRGVGWTVVFVFFFVIYGQARGFAAASAAPGYLLAFFSLGLFLLAVTRLLAIWQETQADPAQALAANRHWLLLLVAVVGAILSGAAFVAGLLNVSFRPVVLQWLRPLAPVVEFIFLALFAAALVIAKVIVAALSRLPLRPAGVEPPETLRQPLSVLLRDLPPSVVSSARWGMVLLVLILLIALIAIAVVRSRRKQRRADEDERESVWDPRSALAGLGRALRGLWRRSAPQAPEEPAIMSIRALYRELLRIGQRLGIPRRPPETPYEYRPRLSGRLAEAGPPIASLTEAYVRVRYTPHAPSEAEVEGARADLERVRQAAVPPDESTDPDRSV